MARFSSIISRKCTKFKRFGRTRYSITCLEGYGWSALWCSEGELVHEACEHNVQFHPCKLFSETDTATCGKMGKKQASTILVNVTIIYNQQIFEYIISSKQVKNITKSVQHIIKRACFNVDLKSVCVPSSKIYRLQYIV